MQGWACGREDSATTPPTTASRSASSKTSCADLPPSSRVTGRSARPAFSATVAPTAVEPVNATWATSGCCTSASPTRQSRGWSRR